MKKIPHYLLIFTLLLNLCIGALAQGTTSRVTGTVTDENGAAIPDATVSLTSEGTQTTFTATTSGSGVYTFESVQIGNYTVTVEKNGFKKFVATIILPNIRTTG